MSSIFGLPPGAMPRYGYWFRRRSSALKLLGAFALGVVCAALIKMPPGWPDRFANWTRSLTRSVTDAPVQEPIAANTSASVRGIRLIVAEREPPALSATTSSSPVGGAVASVAAG